MRNLVRGNSGARLVLGLGAVTVWLVLAAIVGAIAVGGDDDDIATGATGATGAAQVDPATGQPLPGSAGTVPLDPATGQPLPAGSPGVDPATGQPLPAGAAGGTPGAPEGEGAAPGTPAAPAPAAGASEGDRTGVSETEIRLGIHAPITFSGVPLNLAEDPIKGLEAYIQFINENGGVNGRRITLQLADDRFDTPGAQAAANALVNDGQNFIVSGTLGIDQVAIVAAEAQRRGVPYVAAGGAEEVPIPGMYQIAASYTTHVAPARRVHRVGPRPSRAVASASSCRTRSTSARSPPRSSAASRSSARRSRRSSPTRSRPRTPTTTATSSSSGRRTPRSSSRSPTR